MSSKLLLLAIVAAALAAERPRLLDATRPRGGQLLKGRFLDYIYAIRPDHKAPGYSIETMYLHDGYAYGNGPYDGWRVEFFLFRGKKRDLVIERESGYEIGVERQRWGYDHTAFWFEGGRKRKARLRDVMPLREIDRLFARAARKTETGWANYRLLQLPMEGASASLELCKLEPEPPFATKTPCLRIGTLEWNREKFVVREKKTPEPPNRT